MLAQGQRLKRREVETMRCRGRPRHGRFFTLVVAPADEFKAGVVVSKKVAKTAVARNRLRRRVYSLLRWRSKQQPAHLLVIAKTGAAELSFSELTKEISTLLVKE